ncbi:MAG: exodeoxyribonuclease VII small subunit [Alphaproteobacteria bacterium]|nr:exodeoxyribonuclease VII small subunit [Alphaproteobacteria bacterium]
MTPVSVAPDIAAMDFEDALAALEDIVRQLEGGKVRLEEAVGAYERGVRLKQHCEAKLREAKAKVDLITTGADGSLGTVSANIGADGSLGTVPANIK